MPFVGGSAGGGGTRWGVGDLGDALRQGTCCRPIKDGYGHVFVSVLAVRGRVGDVQPTALVDLGRPAFKLGVAELRVGWKAHALTVSVAADREVYRVREQAKVKVAVRAADGQAPPAGAVVLPGRCPLECCRTPAGRP
jgi:hypothetical protein